MDKAETKEYPAGDYAIIELFGHTTLVGRIAEVERFGAKMLAIEPLFNGEFLPAILHGGAAIYRLTPCSAETAFQRQHTEGWHLPTSIRAIVPQALLASPAREVIVPDEAQENDDFDDRPF